MATSAGVAAARPGAGAAERMTFAVSLAALLVFFGGALATDFIFSQTANTLWQNFSIWLITAGLIVGGFAILGSAIAYLRVAGGPDRWAGLGVLLFLLLAWLTTFLNAFVHSRDGWTAVVPEGLMLSLVSVVLLAAGACVAGLMGKSSNRGAV